MSLSCLFSSSIRWLFISSTAIWVTALDTGSVASRTRTKLRLKPNLTLDSNNLMQPLQGDLDSSSVIAFLARFFSMIYRTAYVAAAYMTGCKVHTMSQKCLQLTQIPYYFSWTPQWTNERKNQEHSCLTIASSVFIYLFDCLRVLDWLPLRNFH